MTTWAGDRAWVIVGPAPSRVDPEVPFLVSFFAGLILFVVGIFPAYVFEMDGRLDASDRCPSAVVTLDHDPACVERLVARGPLFLGRGALAVSFLLGCIAIGYWARVSRAHRPRTFAVAVAVAYAAGWAALLVWNAAEGARLVQADLGYVT